VPFREETLGLSVSPPAEMNVGKWRWVEPDSQGPPVRFDFISRLPDSMIISLLPTKCGATSGAFFPLASVPTARSAPSNANLSP
jgi:hypothetical protein